MIGLIRLAIGAVTLYLVMYSLVSLATDFQRDAQIAACIAFGTAVLWLVVAVYDDVIRQRDIVATARPPVLVESDDIEFDDELPWLIRGDTVPLRTEVFDGGRRPHWDTNIMGAPE